MAADQNSKIFAMAKVNESITEMGWDGPVLPGVVLSVTPSVSLTDLLTCLHKNLQKRSIEWVEKKPVLKAGSHRVVGRKDSELWFCTHSDGFPGIYMILTPPHIDYDMTDWRGVIRRMKREGTL